MTTEGTGPSWKDIVQAQIRKWGTRQPLAWTELRPDLYDRVGRPVLEGDSPSNPAGVPNEYRVLNFEEREGLEGNHSAYESISRELDQFFATVSYIHSVLIPEETTATFDDRADIVSTLVNLSTFLALRADNPIKNGEIPTEVAGITKVGRGFMKPYDREYIQQISERYTGISPQEPDFSADVDAFMRYILKHNLLLKNESRANGIACPAPLPIIAKAERVLLGEPVPGMVEAGERLGLSVDEITRARDFGRAVRTIAIEQQVANYMIGMTRKLTGMPDAAKNKIQRESNRAKNIIDSNIAVANRALGRSVVPQHKRKR